MPFMIQFTQGREEWVERIVGDISLVGSVVLPDGTTIGSGSVTSGSPVRRIGGTITSAANVSTGVEDLATVSIAANQLKTNGDSLMVEASFTLAATVNVKATSFVFGGTVVDTRSAADNALPRILRARIVRITNTTQRAYGEAHAQGQGSLVLISTPAETLSAAVNLIVRVQGGAASDITLNYLHIDYCPVA